MRVVSGWVVSSSLARLRKFDLDAVLICFQVVEQNRATDWHCLEECYSVISTCKRHPYLYGISSPKQAMLIGADRPKNWNC